MRMGEYPALERSRAGGPAGGHPDTPMDQGFTSETIGYSKSHL